MAATVLKGLQVDIEQTRQDILRELDPSFVTVDNRTEPPGLESGPAPVHAPLTRRPDEIDADVPYDVYCVEYGSHVVIYRNARLVSVLLAGAMFGAAVPQGETVDSVRGKNVVGLVGRSFCDDTGPFLGLGVTCFQALRHARYDRARLSVSPWGSWETA